MSITISRSNSVESPERYKCPNWDNCHTSSSHDPEYVGWVYTYMSYPSRACSKECAAFLLRKRAAGMQR